MNNPKRNQSNLIPKPAQGGLIPERKDWKETWDRLKKFFNLKTLSDVEKLLVTNDNEALELDPVELSYTHSVESTVFVTQGSSSVGTPTLTPRWAPSMKTEMPRGP